MLPSSNTNARTVVDLVTAAIFLGAIFAPFIDQMVRPVSAREPIEENRNARPAPTAPRNLDDLGALPAAFEAHHADTFGMRDVLLHWSSVVKMSTWGITPTPTVVLDPSGWLDYAGEHTFEVSRGVHPLAQPEIDTWMSYFASCKGFCARNGARYLYVSVPNKETVYPDHVPARYKPLGPSRLDQIVAALPDELRSEFFDLRPALIAARAEDQPKNFLYFENGTHWNGRGGWFGYRAVVQEVARAFPATRALTDADVAWDVSEDTDFDSWGPRLYRPGVFPQAIHMCQIKGPKRWQEVESDLEHGHWHVRNPNASGPRVVVVSDSFGPAFWTLFASTFPEVDFHQSGFPANVIVAEHPDLVIELRVERTFTGGPILTSEAQNLMALQSPPASSDEIVLSIDPSDTHASTVTTGASVEPSGDGLVFRAENGKGGWILPPFEVPATKRGWLHLEIESETPGTLVAYRRKDAKDPWLRREATRVHYDAGRHDHVIAIEGKTGRQQLRLALEGTPAHVILRHVEVHTTDA